MYKSTMAISKVSESSILVPKTSNVYKDESRNSFMSSNADHSRLQARSTALSSPHLLLKNATRNVSTHGASKYLYRDRHEPEPVNTSTNLATTFRAENAGNAEGEVHVIYIMNTPRGQKCKHQYLLRPLVCISTSQSATDTVRVNVLETWDQLGKRMLQALPAIYSRFNASWYFKVDMHTQIDVPRLERALHMLPSCISYVGQVYSFPGHPDYASGGAGYGIRHDALGKMDPLDCVLAPSDEQNFEDVTVGWCLYQHGISVSQLDGLYGDSPEISARLSSDALVYKNHKFPVNVTIHVLSMHESEISCVNRTVAECMEEYQSRIKVARTQLTTKDKSYLHATFNV